MVDAGGLMAYGASFGELYRRDLQCPVRGHRRRQESARARCGGDRGLATIGCDRRVRRGVLPPRACGAAAHVVGVRRPEPWFWTITAREIPPSVDSRGYSATREQAMADFKARWSASIN